MVNLSRVGPDGREAVIDLYGPGEIFGESVFVGAASGEHAVAVERTTVMSCSASEISRIAHENASTSFALWLLVVRRSVQFSERVAESAVAPINNRVATALCHFVDKFGARRADDSIEMPTITHDLLARYVGTSREVVTHVLNRFRRVGCIEYSRKGVTVLDSSFQEQLVYKRGRRRVRS